MGCQTDQQAANYTQPPNAVPIILANKNRLWKDPESIRDAGIGPVERPMIGGYWHVCVRANAKNSFGGYTGQQDMLIGLYDDGREPFVVSGNAPGVAACQKGFEPFPELEGGYRPPPTAKQAKPKA